MARTGYRSQSLPVASLLHSRNEGRTGTQRGMPTRPGLWRRAPSSRGRRWDPASCAEARGARWALTREARRGPFGNPIVAGPTAGPGAALCEAGGEGRPWRSGTPCPTRTSGLRRPNAGHAEAGVRRCERGKPSAQGLCAPGDRGGLHAVCGAETSEAGGWGTGAVAWASGVLPRGAHPGAPRKRVPSRGAHPAAPGEQRSSLAGGRGEGVAHASAPRKPSPPRGRLASAAGGRHRQRKASGVGPWGHVPRVRSWRLPHPGGGRLPRRRARGELGPGRPAHRAGGPKVPSGWRGGRAPRDRRRLAIPFGGDRLRIPMSFPAPAPSFESYPDSPAPPLWITGRP